MNGAANAVRGIISGVREIFLALEGRRFPPWKHKGYWWAPWWGGW